METELKKIGNNIQQLTDAIVTLTAELQSSKASVASLATELKPLEPHTIGSVAIDVNRDLQKPIVTQTTNQQVVQPAVQQPAIQQNVVQPAVQQPAVQQVAVLNNTDEPMTMATANAELQAIVVQMGDGGAAVRILLQSHNAISLAQVPPENYASVVDEARALIPANQA